jgi:hypothetical protein
MELGPELMSWLDDVEALANERLQMVTDQVLSEASILRSEIDVLMEGITDPLLLVANEHQIAADELEEAALRLQDSADAANSGVIPGPGDGYGGPNRPYPNVPHEATSEDIANLTVTTEIAAGTLQSEGAAYREATSEMTSAVGRILAAIPKNVPVELTVRVDDRGKLHIVG